MSLVDGLIWIVGILSFEVATHMMLGALLFLRFGTHRSAICTRPRMTLISTAAATLPAYSTEPAPGRTKTPCCPRTYQHDGLRPNWSTFVLRSTFQRAARALCDQHSNIQLVRLCLFPGVQQTLTSSVWLMGISPVESVAYNPCVLQFLLMARAYRSHGFVELQVYSVPLLTDSYMLCDSDKNSASKEFISPTFRFEPTLEACGPSSGQVHHALCEQVERMLFFRQMLPFNMIGLSPSSRAEPDVSWPLHGFGCFQMATRCYLVPVHFSILTTDRIFRFGQWNMAADKWWLQSATCYTSALRIQWVCWVRWTIRGWLVSRAPIFSGFFCVVHVCGDRVLQAAFEFMTSHAS